jgi:hypothetical protein
MSPSFTSFLFSLPMSLLFISLFLVFSLILIFRLHVMFAAFKNELVLFKHLFHFSHHKITNIRAMSSFTNTRSVLLSGDLQVTLWMFLCWYHVPFTAESLPSANFTFRFPLWFVLLWRLCCALRMLDINRTPFQLYCWSPVVLLCLGYHLSNTKFQSPHFAYAFK